VKTLYIGRIQRPWDGLRLAAVIGQMQLLPDYSPLLRRENAERLTDLPQPRPGLRSLPAGGSPARPSKSFAAAAIRP
jgi:hypothetical protein